VVRNAADFEDLWEASLADADQSLRPSLLAPEFILLSGTLRAAPPMDCRLLLRGGGGRMSPLADREWLEAVSPSVEAVELGR
jgi:hypothetical protein